MNRKVLYMILALALCAAPLFPANAAVQTKALVYAPNYDGNSEDYESDVARIFADAGYSVAPIAATDLCDPAKLTAPKETVLVLPDAGRLPLGSIGPVQQFLHAGGQIGRAHV